MVTELTQTQDCSSPCNYKTKLKPVHNPLYLVWQTCPQEFFYTYSFVVKFYQPSC